VVEISLRDGAIEHWAAGGVAPPVRGDDVFYLEIDDENARRSIGHLRGGVRRESVDDDGGGGGVTIGAPAAAHGNHDVPSTWWRLDEQNAATASTIDPIIVYDAALVGDNTMVYATLEGLPIANDERFDIIRSRAIRFVAA